MRRILFNLVIKPWIILAHKSYVNECKRHGKYCEYKGVYIISDPRYFADYDNYKSSVIAALQLIEKVSMVRFLRLARDIDFICNLALPGLNGLFVSVRKMCCVNFGIPSYRHDIGHLALLIIHEATHAHLISIGTRMKHARIEQICIREERRFFRMAFGHNPVVEKWFEERLQEPVLTSFALFKIFLKNKECFVERR